MKKKSFLVAGLGRFGTSLALSLAEMGHDVLALDRDEERVATVADRVTHAMVADLSEERVAAQLGIASFDCVVVAIGDDLTASVLITILCKEQGARRIVAKAYDDIHAKLLQKIGADEIIQPERDSGLRLARMLSNEDVLGFIEISQTHSITEMRTPGEWVGKSIQALDIRANYHVNVIAVQRGTQMLVSLDSGFVFQAEDELVILGENRWLAEMERL